MPQSQRLLKPVPKRASTPLFLGAENVLLWLRPDSDTVTTGGSRTFTASNKSCFVGTTRITTRTAGVDFWLEFWFKPTGVTGNQVIFSDGGYEAKGLSIGLANAQLKCWFGSASGQTAYASSATIVAGVFTHIVVTGNRTTGGASGLTFYVNGVAAGTGDISAYDSEDCSSYAGGATYWPCVGRLFVVDYGWFFGGSLSHIRYGEGYAPTADNVTWMFNNKNPRTYADYDELGGNLFASLKRNYECNETDPTANLIDQHDLPGDGSNDLVKTHAELITNPSFTSNIDGWAKSGVLPPATMEWDASGAMHIAHTGGAATNVYSTTTIPLIAGHPYTLAINGTRTSDWLYAAVTLLEHITTTRYVQIHLESTGSTSTTFTSTESASRYITVGNIGSSAYDWLLNSISLKATTIAVGNGPAEAIASDSVGTNHATLTGFSAAQLISAWTTDTHNGKGHALTFDGVGNYLQVGSIGLTGARSYSVWVKPSNVGGNNYILDGDENKNWLAITNKNVVIGYGGGTSWYITTDAPISTNGEWYHIVGTLGATDDAHIYVNGVEYTLSKTGSGQFFADSYNIGSYNHGAGFFFAGDLDDLRIYNVALSAAQVAELYLMDEDENSYGTGTGTATVTIPGLVAQWKFEDGPFGQPGEGDPLINWVSKEGDRRLLQQTTAGSRPTYHLSEVNGHPAVYFNGTSMFMSLGSAILSGVEGTVAFAVKFTDPTSCTILSSADTATATKYVALGTNGSDQMQVDQDETDVNTTVRGGTTLGTDWHILFFESNGSAYFLAIDDVDETLVATTGTNNGDWWDDSTGKDNTVLGALVTSGGTSLYFEGYIADIIVYKKCLSVAERTNLYKNYLKPRYL